MKRCRRRQIRQMTLVLTSAQGPWCLSVRDTRRKAGSLVMWVVLPSNQGGLRARVGGNGWFLNPTINSMCSFLAWGSICEFPSNIYCVYGDDGEDDGSTILSLLIATIHIPLLWFMIMLSMIMIHDGSVWMGTFAAHLPLCEDGLHTRRTRILESDRSS